MISGKEERHEGKGGWVEEEENKQRGRRRELGRGEEKMEGEKKRWGSVKKSFTSVNSLNCLSPFLLF